MASIIDLLIAQKISGKSNKTVKLEPLSVTENGEYIAPKGKGYSPVTVNVTSGGGGSDTDAEGVTFIDYDGTVLHTYTKDEFAALTELPANPSHTGLTAQGWNWTLADAQTYVAKYGSLVIGQMYITDDGKTRIYIDIPDGVTGDELTFYVRYGQSVSEGVEVDWGDGSAKEKFTGTAATNRAHTYSSTGKYVITLEAISGTISFSGTNGDSIYGPTSNKYNQKRIYRIENGNNINSIGTSAFQGCYTLETITIPNGVTSIGTTVLAYCYSLKTLIIPDSVKTIDSSAFSSCCILETIIIPNSVTSIRQSAFQACYSLKTITIPDNVTSISNYTFSNCYSLKTLIIPDSVKSIGNYAFSNCYSLETITIPDGVNSIGTSAFQSCYLLKMITIPDSVTSISQTAFQGCYTLETITIPNDMTSINQTIFQNCYLLKTITIPDSVTSIGNYAFSNCYVLLEIHFKSVLPPAIPNANTFSNLLNTCKIYVPTGSLSAYMSAEHYPDPSTYTYIEE